MNRLLLFLILFSLVYQADAQKCLRGNCQTGFGTLVYPNKSRYTGEFQDGWMTGRGIYFYANGNKYVGYWVKNQKQGEGKLVYANGDIYSGKFTADRITGFGSMVYKNGDKYLGEWLNEKPTGKGTYYYATGERYEGEFIAGKYEGKGKFIYTNGSHYEGNWKNDQRNGYGEFFDGKSKNIAGQWKDDLPLKVIETDLSEKIEEVAASDEKQKTESNPSEKIKPTQTNEVIVANEKITPINENQTNPLKDKPVVDKPITDNPVINNPVINKPEENKPIVDKPVADKPLADKPIIEKPIADKPLADKPIIEKPVADKPVNDKPTVDKPLVEKPIVDKPNADKPVVDKPEQKPSNSNPNITISKPNLNHPNQNPATNENLPNCGSVFCKSGKGTLDYADGSKYVGDFLNGEPKGKGICYYANGDRYEGLWENHAPNGEGVMYFKSGLIYGAIWDHGTAKKQLTSKQEFVFNPDIKEDKNAEVKIWAVVVGVSRYETMPSLKYSDDDAYKIYAFLKSPEGGALPDGQIKLLIDEDATRVNILQAMNEVCLKADDNDVVMMYFSGHGLEGTFIPSDYDGYQNALKHDELRELFNKSHAKHKVCYADACHSGSLLAAKSPFANELNFFYEELDKSSGGTAFMMSSKSKEYSLEDGGLRQGIFSHYLIRGLKGEADSNKNNTITIRELFDYVSKNVKEYSGSAQSPVIAGDYDENMPVGFVRTR